MRVDVSSEPNPAFRRGNVEIVLFDLAAYYRRPKLRTLAIHFRLNLANESVAHRAARA